MRAALVPPSSRSTAGVFALALALWLASTLGLVHRTVHVHGAPGSASQVAVQGAAQVAAPAHALAALFGLHTDAECRLYDQLAHGAAAPAVPLLALPALLPNACFAWFEGVVVARWIAHFDARGPPSTR